MKLLNFCGYKYFNKGEKMKDASYKNTTTTRNGYRDQLIHYYNKGVGRISEIAGVKITDRLIGAIEKRYKQLGGKLPISQEDIDKQEGKKWSL